jgi:hypothetical protein
MEHSAVWWHFNVLMYGMLGVLGVRPVLNC